MLRKLLILVLLVEGVLCEEKITNNNSIDNLKIKEKGPQYTQEDQIASPSMTSVHQVWTSTSSGSLDELSPEIIRKLRNDVPFLAAYATRPRLVGVGGNQNSLNESPSQPIESYADQDKETNSLISEEDTLRLKSVPILQAAASSTQSIQESLVPKLGDFNEFKVETLSSSKSEHHHNRKTSLKRNPKESSSSGLRRLALKKSTKSGKNKRNGRLLKTSKTYKRNGKSYLRSKVGDNRLRRRPIKERFDHRMVSSKILLQESPSSTSSPSNLDDQVKGGNHNSNAKPFYANARPTSSIDHTGDQRDDKESVEADNSNGSSRTGEKDILVDAEQEKPRRVGDPDVDEDGDTVTIEPKYDGVDDDPDVPIEEAQPSLDEVSTKEGPGEDQLDDQEKPLVKPKSDGSINDGDDGDGYQGNRDYPDVGSNADDDKLGGNSAATGGGIGSVQGLDTSERSPDSGDSVSMNSADTDSLDDSKDDTQSVRNFDSHNSSGKDQDNTRSKDSKSGHDYNRDESGVEFAGDSDDYESGSREKSRSEEGGDTTTNSIGMGGLSTREPKDKSAKKPEFLDDGLEKIDKESGSHNSSAAGDNCHHVNDMDHHDHHHHGIDWLRGSIPGEPGDDYPILSRANGTSFNCRDHKDPGYYADVESRCQMFHICQSDGRQDSFLCPNGTIFSQRSTVCVWWNSFDCEASSVYSINLQVDSPDVRITQQESIESSQNLRQEKAINQNHLSHTTNSINHQKDAPKYYHLNGLLYKSSLAATSPASDRELRPLANPTSRMGNLRPKDMSREDNTSDEDESSIDRLIREMKRNKASEEDLSSASRSQPKDNMESLGRGKTSGSRTMDKVPANDEATIQRKSTNTDDYDSEPSPPAKLRRAVNAEPRRKRRASVKQMPPKLKSRRVSRNSRRRKLRHGIKRRA